MKMKRFSVITGVDINHVFYFYIVFYFLHVKKSDHKFFLIDFALNFDALKLFMFHVILI